MNPLRVLAKGLLLFAAFNAAFGYLGPNLAVFSVFGSIVPRLAAFPTYTRYTNAQAAHQMAVKNVFDLGVLFASHAISGKPKAAGEYRVIAVGDSTTKRSQIWSWINQAGLKTCNGRLIQVYDLGYDQPQIVKDLLILHEAMKYHPDLILWSFAENAFVDVPGDFARANPAGLSDLAVSYNLPVDAPKIDWASVLLSRTFIGRRRELYTQMMLDLDAVMLTPGLGENNGPATDIAAQDTAALGSIPVASPQAVSVSRSKHLFAGLDAGYAIAGDVPVILISEPINFGKPRFDRELYARFNGWMQQLSASRRWTYLSYWDLLSPAEFSDVIHRNTAGDEHMQKELIPAILSAACSGSVP